MSGNTVYRFNNAAILSVVAVDAPEVVTSEYFDERLAPTLQRLGVRPGMLQQLAGIEERRWWPPEVSFSDAAAQAGARALVEAGIAPGADRAADRHVGVPRAPGALRSRGGPQPALGLPSSCLNFDLSNACLGFVNGMQLAAMMIDSGQIEYALIVDGEGSRTVQEHTLDRLLSQDTTAAGPVLRLRHAHPRVRRGGHGPGPCRSASGGARVRRRRRPRRHRAQRAVPGRHGAVVTDSKGLLLAGLDVAEATWKDAGADFDWTDVQHYVMHQVSTVHCGAMIQRLRPGADLVPLTFPTRGNIGPAAIPITLAMHQEQDRDTGTVWSCWAWARGSTPPPPRSAGEPATSWAERARCPVVA